MENGIHVAVLGATGAVGREFLHLMESRNWPVSRLSLLASARSAGSVVEFMGKPLEIIDADKFDTGSVKVALLSAGSGPSKSMGPRFVEAGALVVDNSSAFRMDPSVPLVVPEINLDAVAPNQWLVANPNCCTIILLMAVAPLRSLGLIKRVIVSTYQSASGAGAAAMEELHEQTVVLSQGGTPAPKVFRHQIAYNLFSHNASIEQDGLNGEETKVIEEARKILARPDLGVNPTCVRVPVPRAHSESITVEFHDKAPPDDAVRAALAAFPGVSVVDDRENNHFPMPNEASGRDEVLVGRIRQDPSNPNAVCLFACGDQLLKGAALNAVQIAEELGARRGIFRVPRLCP